MKESVEQLLKEIKEEKNKLISEKVIKKEKNIPPLEESEIPYEIDGRWKWVRLVELTKLVTKQTGFDYTNHIKPNLLNSKEVDSYPYLQTRNFSKKNFSLETQYYVPKKTAVNFPKLLLNDPSLLLSIVGASIGNVGLYSLKETAFLGGAICKVDLIDSRLYPYIYYYLISPHGQNQIKKNEKSTAQATITVQNVREALIPLPPLETQKQIVAKLESMLGKINEARELISEAKEGFQNRRTAILAKAFRGELTAKWREQNLEIETADFICNQVRKEYLSAFKLSDKEKTKYSNEFNDFKKEFEQDEYSVKEWAYLKTKFFCEKISAGSTPTKFLSPAGEIPFLKVYNIVENQIDFDYKPQFIPREIHETKLKRARLKPNDVIMNIVGPPLRKIAIIPSQFEEWNMNQAIVRFRPIKLISNKYLYYSLLWPQTLDAVIEKTRGVVGQSNISVSQSQNLIIPIPSLREQNLIVEKLDHFFEFEDKSLELISIEDNIELIEKSILSKAFRGEF